MPLYQLIYGEHPHFPLDYAALCDINIQYLDILLWLLFVRPDVFYLMDHVQPLDRAAKDSVLVVKPRLVCRVS